MLFRPIDNQPPSLDGSLYDFYTKMNQIFGEVSADAQRNITGAFLDCADVVFTLENAEPFRVNIRTIDCLFFVERPQKTQESAKKLSTTGLVDIYRGANELVRESSLTPGLRQMQYDYMGTTTPKSSVVEFARGPLERAYINVIERSIP